MCPMEVGGPSSAAGDCDVAGIPTRQRAMELAQQCMDCESFGGDHIPSALQELKAAAAAYPDLFSSEALEVLESVPHVGEVRAAYSLWVSALRLNFGNLTASDVRLPSCRWPRPRR